MSLLYACLFLLFLVVNIYPVKFTSKTPRLIPMPDAHRLELTRDIYSQCRTCKNLWG